MSQNKDVKYVGDSRVPAERKKLRPRPYSEYPGKTEPFFPNFLLKEWMVAVIVLVAFLMLVVISPAPLEPAPANPNEPNYIPLPDWYFLFLYQLLKYFPGDLKVVGSVVIPGIFGLLFLLAPWLDRGPERRPSKRPISTGIMLVVVVSIVLLTYLAIVDHEKQVEASNEPEQSQDAGSDGGSNSDGGNVAVLPDFDGAAAAKNCLTCHGANLEGTPAGPTLVGLTYSVDEVADIIKKGKGTMPPGMFTGTDEEVQALASWILEHQ